jgi:hypothetical protein
MVLTGAYSEHISTEVTKVATSSTDQWAIVWESGALEQGFSRLQAETQCRAGVACFLGLGERADPGEPPTPFFPTLLRRSEP